MGYYVHMDENGDAEGNYTLIARKEIPGTSGKYGLFPVAIFQLAENRSNIQASRLTFLLFRLKFKNLRSTIALFTTVLFFTLSYTCMV